MAIKAVKRDGDARPPATYPRLMRHRDLEFVALVGRDGTAIYVTDGKGGHDAVGHVFRVDAEGHKAHWVDFDGSVTISNAD